MIDRILLVNVVCLSLKELEHGGDVGCLCEGFILRVECPVFGGEVQTQDDGVVADGVDECLHGDE